MVIPHSGSYLGIGGIDIDEERAKALNLKEVRGVEIVNVEAVRGNAWLRTALLRLLRHAPCFNGPSSRSRRCRAPLRPMS